MTADKNTQDITIRFSVLHRFLHLVVMIGFTGLAVTGLSLGFSIVWILLVLFRTSARAIRPRTGVPV